MLLKQHFFLLLLFLSAKSAQGDAPIALPGCADTCGQLKIPFPFGVGSNCSLNSWYEVYCNASTPVLPKLGDIKVTDIESQEASKMLTVELPLLRFCPSSLLVQRLSSIDLGGSPYSFSAVYNDFVSQGCGGSVVWVDHTYQVGQSKEIRVSCATTCNSSMTTAKGCSGDCSCQSQLPFEQSRTGDCSCQSQLPFEQYRNVSNLQSYEIEFNGQSSVEGQNCLAASLVERDFLNQYGGNLSTSDSFTTPVVLLWTWNISQMPENISPHTECHVDPDSNNLTCKCKHPYYGNPYAPDRCQAPMGCKGCHGHCLPGPTANSFICEAKPRMGLTAILGLSIGIGSVLLAIGCYGLYAYVKRCKKMKRRAKFFKLNGGLLLQQQLSSNDGFLERTKIFTTDELEKATDHFNKDRILGQGGQGTVYKGMLSDGRIVAIKKAKLLDRSQLVQFINEVVILSQINHRNVVKLLGCCLETEVPLLVYEFVPNGTLSQHIHDPDEDSVLSWELRLKIAAESASAVAYLHSSSSIPIYHRDIKPSNILLDEKKRAKVSDFGSSRTIEIDQTHLTTQVQGTKGYVDPVYYQSYQFTEKSDVYSFGVVLLEMLTGKKPIYRAENMQQKNLVTEFINLLQKSELPHILDPEIVKEAKEEELKAVVELAKRCLNWTGKLRPTMKQVAKTLEMIIESPKEVSNWEDEDGFPWEEFTANAMADYKVMSSQLPAGGGSPIYIDVHPPLPNTI